MWHVGGATGPTCALGPVSIESSKTVQPPKKLVSSRVLPNRFQHSRRAQITILMVVTVSVPTRCWLPGVPWGSLWYAMAPQASPGLPWGSLLLPRLTQRTLSFPMCPGFARNSPRLPRVPQGSPGDPEGPRGNCGCPGDGGTVHMLALDFSILG